MRAWQAGMHLERGDDVIDEGNHYPRILGIAAVCSLSKRHRACAATSLMGRR